MLCNVVASKLSAYHDQELTGREMLAIREHLHHCAECAAESQMVLALKDLVNGSQVPEPPADLEARLIQNVLGEDRGVQARPSLDWPRLVGVAAGIVALAIMVNFAQERTRPAPGYDPSVTAEIQRDQAFMNNSDPLSGVPMAVPPAYANR